MINLTEKFNKVLDDSKQPYPQGGIYWNLGLIHQNCITTTKQLIKDLLEKIKNENNLTFDVETYIKENYE